MKWKNVTGIFQSKHHANHLHKKINKFKNKKNLHLEILDKLIKIRKTVWQKWVLALKTKVNAYLSSAS